MAVCVLVCTVFALSFGDALVRKMGLAADYQMSIWQIVFLRSLIALPILLLLCARRLSRTTFMPNRWVLLRSAMLAVMWVFYYAALSRMPFSVAAAAYYTLPLFILVFSALFAGERIGGIGAIGIVLGFVGVLIITNPRASGVSLWLLMPLCAAMLYALSMILTRTRCATNSIWTLAIWLNVTFVAVGGAGLVLLPDGASTEVWRSTWVPVSGAGWRVMLVSAIAIVIGAVGTAFAYQRAPSAMLGAFDFSYLAFAILWGWLMFGEAVDAPTLFGILLIVVAGGLALMTSGSIRTTEA
ncbi:Threonine/homoserine efflux transporter RhtA [Octadecabacter temperatus]|uniref:EamA-like transporter family protein n=1 Tax=Octadecabacter temperatus TaxID=1458307 RepID=A0A0K0Y2U7_9RHOB|nr:EamA-like transporter family protein [Octadecabacter temperatus]SIN89408.1 Threonine/homoserine efflux transporter RhtA [Octadecabacter temperatus]